ncbi:MAG: branched-chain amino acid ABC transporter substrate-binding protein [Anaerolineae bacterium]|jgi:branched-chain amino acid transport system substrate-binding protein|nr:branched-chain amino acid ABC transporter substrate-binding protein [Anaerolineae bacterium]MDH7473975.1 branched-chain amino acid ABC transporter substrate-binding protein [Anaerolineae bacterium]
MRRQLLSLLLLLTMSACRFPGSTRPVVKIGLVAPFEGLYRPLGYDALYGVKLAVRERNAAGGVGGAMVELVALDDHFDPARAADVAREMAIDPDVMGVIGPLSSAMALAAQPEYQHAELAFITLAIADELTSGDHTGTFRLSARDSDLGTFAASYIVNELGMRRVAVLRQGSEKSVNAFTKAVEQAGAQVVWDGQAEGDWLADLQLAAPEAIFVGGDSLVGADMVRLIRDTGLTATLIGGQEWAMPHLVNLGGKAVEGVLYVTNAPAPVDVGADEFIADYQALAGFPPGPYGAWAYDATCALLTALDRAIRADGRPTRAGVTAQLTALTDYQGLHGVIAFDQLGNRLNALLYIYRVEGNTYPGRLIWQGSPPGR